MVHNVLHWGISIQGKNSKFKTQNSKLKIQNSKQFLLGNHERVPIPQEGFPLTKPSLPKNIPASECQQRGRKPEGLFWGVRPSLYLPPGMGFLG
jgi:hypothetical protein